MSTKLILILEIVSKEIVKIVKIMDRNINDICYNEKLHQHEQKDLLEEVNDIKKSANMTVKYAQWLI
jgi:hypothetical protein